MIDGAPGENPSDEDLSTEDNETLASNRVAADVGGTFWKSALLFVSGAVVIQAINFVAQPVFAWLMPPGALGITANYLFWSTLFSLLISLQLHATLNSAVATYGRERVSDYIATIGPLLIGMTALLLLVLLINPGGWEKLLSLPWAYLLAAVINGAFTAITFMALNRAIALGARREYLSLMFASTLGPLAFGLVLVALMPDKTDLARVIAYLSAGALLAVWLMVRGLKVKTSRVNEYIPFALALSLPLLVHEVLFIIINQSNRVFLKGMVSDEAAGIFAFANSMGNVGLLVASAINNAWVPWYFAATKASVEKVVRRSASQISLGFAALVGAGILVAPDLLRLVTKPVYDPGADIIGIFLVSGVFTFIFNLSSNYLVYCKRTAWVLLISGFAATLSIGLNLYLIPRYGIAGAAISAAAATMCLALGALLVAGVVLKCPNLPMSVLLAAMVLGGIFLGVEELLAQQVVLRWILAGLVGSVGLVGFLVWRRKKGELTVVG